VNGFVGLHQKVFYCLHEDSYVLS